MSHSTHFTLRRIGSALAATAVLAPLGACGTEKPPTPPATATASVHNVDFGGLEKEFDARLGVFALDTGSGRTVAYRADERFAYCSTFKALAAAAILKKAQPGELDQRITYTQADMQPNSPVTVKHLNEGMPLRDILDAAVRYSDNIAGNLMLAHLGGPQGMENELRALGDTTTEMDRFEIALSDSVPGDQRDTSTPRAWAGDFQKYLLEDVLPTEARTLLTTMMRNNMTGDGLIRAGVPAGWQVADKTGSGDYGVRNDIAVIWPPNRAPLMLAIMTTRSHKDDKYDKSLLAKATQLAISTLG